MIVAILDTETNGRDPGEVIEVALAVADVRKTYQSLGAIPPGEFPGLARRLERFEPERGSTFKALAVHGIMDAELRGKRPSREAKGLVCDIECIVAHNASFDLKVLDVQPPLVIDTLALSRAFCPDDEGHTLGAMMFRVGPRCGQQYMLNAHEAAADVDSCGMVLDWLVERFVAPTSRTWGSLAHLSEALAAPQTIPFGKHKGTTWTDLDYGYIKWYLNQADQDPVIRERMLREQSYRFGSLTRCPHCDGLQAIVDDESGLWSICSCFAN